ncbi:MAG: adenylosuccinate synthase [Dehalococcoidia bacterium]|nr:adenylosuccinate synthase [Dehalococcoidia bacterium]
MPLVTIVGGQWGDEGKGKIVDMLAQKADVVARFAGGANAGHTVINPLGTFKMHLIPSGIFYPNVVCVMGNGMAIDPKKTIEEISFLREKHINVDNRLFISDKAHLIMPYHFILDKLEEERRGGDLIGTTCKGIGPAYVDKVARRGIRAGDLLNRRNLLSKLRPVVDYKNELFTKLYDAASISVDEIYEQCCHYSEILAPFIKETSSLLQEAQERGALIILEGAQGTLLDIDFGTYPYVTSSSPTAWGACSGLGISPMKIDRILGIFKAYTTRVGKGPMPTELNDEVGEAIREKGHEYGTTTGRPRRCGWFDSVAGRFSVHLNGITDVAFTRLDVLDLMPHIKICTGYNLDGKVINQFPCDINEQERCTPILEEMDGWQTCTNDVRHFDNLPPAAKAYVKRIEELIDCPISVISVGAKREQSIEIRPIL